MNIEKNTNKIMKAIRLLITDQPGFLGKIAVVIGNHNVNIGDIRLINHGNIYNTRDIMVFADSEQVIADLVADLGSIEGVIVDDIVDPVLTDHVGGKLKIVAKAELRTPSQLSRIYTPGVANVCRAIVANPSLADRYTIKGNTVGIVTNGTAVLGLGNIGPLAGMPVMEGKALLLEQLVGLYGFPILIDSNDPDEIVNIVTRIAPTFGAINLEDIRSPECFEIERRLIETLPIPVMHDDQHGTASVVLAALINISSFVGINIRNDVVGIIGLGAAGTGIAKLLRSFGVRKVYGFDIAEDANERLRSIGGYVAPVDEIMRRSDIVIGTTGVPNLIKKEWVRSNQVILALSNPNPEIIPEVARQAGALFAADGKSINNALAFPGLYRGALDARATKITDAMKIAAAETIASFAKKDELVPAIIFPELHRTVAEHVRIAAIESGVAQKSSR